MLARVEIENKEGTSLLRYKNPLEKVQSNTPVCSVQESQNGLVYKGYFLNADNLYLVKEVLCSLIRDLGIETEAFVIKKHATVYAYIDNYLTTRNSIFPIPRRKKPIDPFHLTSLSKRKVFVEVSDFVFQRITQSKGSCMSYGQIATRPTEDVGMMCLKIDSRSMCGMNNIQFNSSVCTKREGVTTLLTCPSKKMSVMNYTFQCNESSLPVVRAVMIDSRTIELILSVEEDLCPETFKCSVFFDFSPGSIRVECKKGKYDYVAASQVLTWTVSPKESLSLIIHASEPHKSSATVKYSYILANTALSSVLVTSLNSEADENWIKHTTSVSGLLKIQE
ncbi:hypothetical protein NEOKW01_1534 [Nematocida sp. AWRm80]|nr:hypothetical protein NEOKW01_1534 [Nematocida sp. AWRm80]